MATFQPIASVPPPGGRRPPADADRGQPHHHQPPSSPHRRPHPPAPTAAAQMHDVSFAHTWQSSVARRATYVVQVPPASSVVCATAAVGRVAHAPRRAPRRRWFRGFPRPRRRPRSAPAAHILPC